MREPIDVRKLTAAEIADQQRGAERLGPGVWRDRHGFIHWSIVALLEGFGLDDTPEHRAAVIGILTAIADEHRAELIRQDPADEDSEEPDGFLG